MWQTYATTGAERLKFKVRREKKKRRRGAGLKIEKKVVGSAQKLRVGRGAQNTAIFFFWP